MSSILSTTELLLATHLNEEQRQYLQATRVRAEQLLEALSNAPEYTALAVGGSPGGQDCFVLRVSVRDTGVGIPPHQLKHIFEPFRQLEGGLARSHPALGLGLALVERLVRLMGGEVAARSEPGRGTVLEFGAPLRRHVFG